MTLEGQFFIDFFDWFMFEFELRYNIGQKFIENNFDVHSTYWYHF